MLWKIFQINKKINYLISFCIVLFNLIAAVLEGISFILLLSCFSVLTGQSVAQTWIQYLPIGESNPFLASLLGAIILQIFRSIVVYLGQLMTSFLMLNVQQEMHKQIYRRVFSMHFREVAELKRGDLMHVVTSPPTFIPILFEEYNRFIVCSLMLSAYLLLMMRISFSLTCLNIVLFAMTAFVQRIFFQKIRKASHQQEHQVASLSQQTAQSLEGLKVVHLLNIQGYILEKMQGTLGEIAEATLKIKKWNTLIPCLNESIGIILVGLSLIFGVWILQQKGMSYAAHICVYLTLTYRLGIRLQQLMHAKGVITSHSGQMKRIRGILNSHSIISDSQNVLKPKWNQHISFEGVSFMYPHKNHYALKNISLNIPKKQIVALVGASGAGKSSLINLLLRLYPPTQGIISVDGIPIETYSYSNWRQLFGVVSQDAFLFNTTIEENIRFSKLDASYEEIIQAAEMAGADSFIHNLPNGYQTVVGEKGYRLSGGEKQRISLAAALVRDPEILVLDEATSHLDSGSEQIVQEALLRLRKDKTMLVVAHRLSTIQMADKIYVLENGRITESGTHKDLIHLGGRYQMFWNLQTTNPQPLDLDKKFSTSDSTNCYP